MTDKNDLFAQYQILEDLGDFPSYSLFKVKAPNGTIKLWKKVDLQFNAASIETRLLPVIEKVSHPYLNAVSGSFLFQDKGLLFVESEFPAKTLRHRLDEIRANAGGQNVGIPISELFSYMTQAAEAIDYLNASQHVYQGKKIAIYHRALSPDSLHLFEEKGKIVCKVGDFGLAKPITDSNEAARHSLGLTNYDYAPPEFDEGLTTNTSDQYSLATTYHELRTGRLPFTGSLLQKLQAQLSGNPDLSLLEPNERPVVARALNRDPQSRFPSCREFMKQLQLALGGVVTVQIPAPGGASARAGTASAEPVGPSGSLFGGANSGWALNARPVGRSGGALFNVQAKGPINTPAKPEGFTLGTPAPAAPPPTPVATPKAPEIRPAPARVLTPAQAEGWSMETAQDKGVTTPPPATPGKAAAEAKPAGSSNPDIRITPPPPQPPARAESISSKARETLELIKRKQGGPSQPAVPPPQMDKQVPGSKFLNAGSTAGMPALPPARVPPPRAVSKPPGALGETPAAPRPPNIPTPRRASTPSMGLPLPSRHMAAQNVAARSPSPAAPVRRASGGLPEQPTRGSSADPFEAIRNNLPASRGERPSWVTLLMVSIAAFCIGMLILAYLTRK
ncbi:MAG: protein kinase [Gemmatales bacterium]